jgi:nicotinate-nucleotide adenylyltransferase
MPDEPASPDPTSAEDPSTPIDIGLFGGSFNPPHIAHCVVANVVRDQFGLDEVWWIPNAQPPHKPESELAPAEHRLAMTRAITGDDPGFHVSDIEIRREGISYTVDTVRTLQDEHPNTRFALIIGSDSLDSFASWHKPDEIAARVPIIVYKRPGPIESIAAPRFANSVRFVSAPVMEISGTEVRLRRQAGRSIRYFVPEPVRDYIETNGLYLPDE